MRSRGGWWLVGALCALAIALIDPRALAGTTAAVTTKWNTQSIVKIFITPNYHTGFGQVPATIGTQPAPTHGPNAVSNGGSVDFGTILAGKNYLYKYAVHVNVQSTDASGVNLYGEGAANFFNTNDSSTLAIDQTVYFLNSTNSTDSNTGFSPASPFLLTSGTVSGGGQFSAPTIAYTVYPVPIAQSTTANADYYYDYQLHVPVTATGGLYYVWIVYTAIGR